MDRHERFWSKVVAGDSDSCWEWNGAHVPKGYGSIGHWNGRSQESAHRAMVELLTGCRVPVGMQIDHLCRNRGCVNPWHLEVVSPRTNVLRGVGRSAENAAKTHCKRGHELAGSNLSIDLVDGGARFERRCKTCVREQARVRRAAASGRPVGLGQARFR